MAMSDFCLIELKVSMMNGKKLTYLEKGYKIFKQWY